MISSGDYDMYQLVSIILRSCRMMVSSRYHHRHLPLSLVASAGVTMDERIRNLITNEV
ncbi:MAG: hypothetical protein IPG76_23745 [Acidobacteria bacterium]|nr:hypothetical protein [Acidobacteriota bacterium]